MGLGTRIFIVKEDDSLERLSLKKFNGLTKGYSDERLLKLAGKRMRYALIVLEMIDRKPVEILMTEYSFLTFDSEGRLDANEREDTARLAMDTPDPIAPEPKSGKVINVKHRFAKKKFDDRYIWKPAPETKAAIEAIIFKK